MLVNNTHYPSYQLAPPAQLQLCLSVLLILILNLELQYIKVVYWLFILCDQSIPSRAIHRWIESYTYHDRDNDAEKPRSCSANKVQ